MNEEEFLVKPPFPKFVQFETSTTCNANCLMCTHSKMKRHGVAKWSLINKIIHETAKDGESVCPFLMQEPFLEPRLTAILANLKQNNPYIKTSVFSNMSMVSDEQITQIVDLDLLDFLGISFYGPTKELYEKWQPPLNREGTILNIKKFFVYRHHKKRTKPQMILYVLEVPEILNAQDGYKDVIGFVDQMVAVHFDTFHGNIPYMGIPQTEKPRIPCERLWSGINIHFDGSVVPCCIDYDDENVLGNANKDSLHDIWLNDNFTKFRQLHMEKRWDEIPMCRNCNFYKGSPNLQWVEYWQNRG